jgi:hypothetical protein
MQSHRYFLKVNDQELEQVIVYDKADIIKFINEHFKPGEDNKLIFYRIIKWLEGASDKVLEVKKNIIFETVTPELKETRKIVKKIEERKELINCVQASILPSDFFKNLGLD